MSACKWQRVVYVQQAKLCAYEFVIYKMFNIIIIAHYYCKRGNAEYLVAF